MVQLFSIFGTIAWHVPLPANDTLAKIPIRKRKPMMILFFILVLFCFCFVNSNILQPFAKAKDSNFYREKYSCASLVRRVTSPGIFLPLAYTQRKNSAVMPESFGLVLTFLSNVLLLSAVLPRL